MLGISAFLSSQLTTNKDSDHDVKGLSNDFIYKSMERLELQDGLGYPSQATGLKLVVEKIYDRQRFSNLILQEINHIYR